MADRHDNDDAFSDRDDSDEVTIADLRAFQDQVAQSVAARVRGELEAHDRDEARRERVATAVAPAVATTPSGQPVVQVDPLDQMARQLGISRDSLERAAARARAAEQAEELRPFIAACIREELPAALDELLVDDNDDQRSASRRDGSRTNGSRSARSTRPSGNGTSGGGSATDATLPDTAPGESRAHWSERSLW